MYNNYFILVKKWDEQLIALYNYTTRCAFPLSFRSQVQFQVMVYKW